GVLELTLVCAKPVSSMIPLITLPPPDNAWHQREVVLSLWLIIKAASTLRSVWLLSRKNCISPEPPYCRESRYTNGSRYLNAPFATWSNKPTKIGTLIILAVGKTVSAFTPASLPLSK